MLAMVVIINFSFKGTPWGKANFTKRTQQYLSQINYDLPNEYDLSTIRSFKTGKYKSVITLPNGIYFQVLEDYSDQLFDNYYTAKVESTVSNEASKVIKSIFEDDSRVNLDMGGGYGINKKLTETSSYTNLSEDVKMHATLYITLVNSYTLLDENIFNEKCSKLFEWITTNNYDSNVFISFNDGYVINIDYNELRVLKDEDVLRRAVKLKHRE
ncbi:hypothetical protein [Paenibacillus gorillae]|uniref:hypothetical protein n=1 Tax=Paenibacillus gorillae TaxID=1243662 RepID=UPI0012DC6A66|nr:hypothetical protein [Paenibacillus gorillae]